MDNTSPAAAVRSSGTPQPLDARQLSRQPRLPLLSADNELSVQCGRVLLVVLILAVWEFGAGRWFDIFFFSKPSLILAFLAKEVVDPQFYRDLGVTGMELGMGYGIGGVGGIVFGILLARWRFVGRLADPFLLAFNSIPRIAIAPMLIVWFGIGMASKVFLAATLVFFITFFNTLSGIRGVERALCNVARVQGASEWQIFTKVMMPHASAWIMTGLKMSLPFALVGVVLGEFLVASVGLGYRLNSYATSYNTTGAIGMIIVMMLIMMGLTGVAGAVDRRLMAWRPSNDEASAALKA
jgi:NitT/TauT family transport system permease protein